MNKLLMVIMTYFLIFVVGCFSGKMNKKNMVYGVTIKEEDLKHPELIKIKKQFLQFYALLLGLPMIVLIVLELRAYRIWYFMIFTGLWILWTPVLFVRSHKKVKQFKIAYSPQGENKAIIKSASLDNRKKELPSLKKYFLVAWLIIFLTAIVTMISYQAIPDQIPMHYDFNGEITNYADKSIGIISFMILTQIGLTLLVYASTYFSIKYSKRKLNPKKPETSALQHQIAMKRYAALMAGVAIIVNLIFAIIQFSMIGLYEFSQSLSNFVTFVPIVIIMLGMAWFFITTGMSGDKIKVDIREETLDVETIDEEEAYWKGGLIYYNKNDSSVFVQKRFGGGFTINFGSFLGKLMGVMLLLIIVLSIVLPLIFL